MFASTTRNKQSNTKSNVFQSTCFFICSHSFKTLFYHLILLTVHRVTPFVCAVKFQYFLLLNISWCPGLFRILGGFIHYNGHLRVREIWTNFPIILSHRFMKNQTKTHITHCMYAHKRNTRHMSLEIHNGKKSQKITTFHPHKVKMTNAILGGVTHTNTVTTTGKRATLYNRIRGSPLHALAKALISK